MGGVCSSLCGGGGGGNGSGSNMSYSGGLSMSARSTQPASNAKYSGELMDGVEFASLLRMDARTTDDADILMGVADADLGRTPQSEWERNPRVLTPEEIQAITRKKIDEIIRQQTAKDKELETQYAEQEERLKKQEEEAIVARRGAARAAHQPATQSQATSAFSHGPAAAPATPQKAAPQTSAIAAPATPAQSKLTRADSDSFMSPDMRRWLDDDSDAGALTNPAALAASSATAAALAAEPLPPAQTTLFSGSHVDPGASAAASSITSAAATRTPPTFTDSSDDFDSFLEAAKVRSSAPAQIESILPPVVSTPATFGSNDVASSMEPPPLSVGDDDQWGGFLSPELMQATINAGSVLE